MPAASIIDVNITLGQWPTRRVPCDELPALAAKLHQHNVIEAWAGSYDGLFHEDLTAVNNRLADDCRAQTAVRLIPFGEINPLLPNWQAELARCAEHHRMPGVRLHPNYHGYALDHPDFALLLKAVAERDLIAQLTVLMEDDRMMHPLMRVAPVDLRPLAALVEQTPGLRLILLNALKGPRDDKLIRLLNTNGVYCEIAMLEGVGALEQLITEVSVEKILFGSHAPSLYFESASLKLRESALPVPHVRTIVQENARRL
ncbi:MAG: amidohydrolase [Planctomycetes bacterium]|nr:amidohydrolase [Planctomycetota bacterium]